MQNVSAVPKAIAQPLQQRKCTLRNSSPKEDATLIRRVYVRYGSPRELSQLVPVLRQAMAHSESERARHEASNGLVAVPLLDGLPCNSTSAVIVACAPFNQRVGVSQLQFHHETNSIDELASHAYLCNLGVLPQWQSSGVGSALLSACIAEAEARRCSQICLHAFTDAPSVINLYLCHGFTAADATSQSLLEGCQKRATDDCGENNSLATLLYRFLLPFRSPQRPSANALLLSKHLR